MAEPSGSSYPGSIDSLSTLMADQVNQKSFILSGAHNDITTTISTDSTITGISAPNYILIGSEVIYFTGINLTDFIDCIRGADGTTAAEHNNGDAIYHVPVANWANQIRKAIIATQTELGTDPAGTATNLKARLAVSLTDNGMLKAISDFKTILGWNAGVSLTTANFIVGIGDRALQNHTSGYWVIGIGSNAVNKSTTAEAIIGIGESALAELTTGDNTIGIGNSAGRFQSDGSALSVPTKSIYIGNETRSALASGGSPDNEIVIGHGATGYGDNSVTIGNTSIVKTILKGAIFTGDTDNANMTVGLTINQGINDNEIIALKSSDIAHGITGVAETDTYGLFKKETGIYGGLLITGLTESYAGTIIYGIGTTGDTSKSLSSNAYVRIHGYKKSGSSYGNPATNENSIAFYSGNNCAGLFAGGSLYLESSLYQSAWDEYNDLDLLDTMRHITGPKISNYLKKQTQKMFINNLDILEASGVINTNLAPGEDGSIFIAIQPWTFLLADAIRQIGRRYEEKIIQIENRLTAMQ